MATRWSKRLRGYYWKASCSGLFILIIVIAGAAGGRWDD